MKEKLKAYLLSENAFDAGLPDYLDKMTKAVTGELPLKMKLSIAVSELVLFTSQMRRNIELTDKTQVPINSITFVLAGSGTSKDRTANGMRKCFKRGYDVINKKRESLAIERAKVIATAEGSDDPDADYKKYYVKPKPLFAAISTVEGMIKYMNQLEKDKVGAAFIYAGELGSELQTNSTIVDNIRLLSEMYDLGKKEVKILKSDENQSEEINNLPFSALFIGSHENILYDDAVKSKFKLEFTTKLARRGFFNFNPHDEPRKQYEDVHELLKAEQEADQLAYKYRTEIDEMSEEIARFNLGTNTNKPIRLSDKAQEIFYAYKRYNEEVAEDMSKLFPITQLVRKHAQWRALKLSGALALFDKSEVITDKHYKQAMFFVEQLDDDMVQFEDELRKEKYEQFVDYMKFISDNGKASIGIHKLRKMGYIPTGSTGFQARLKELASLAASYDPNGVYTVVDSTIQYEELQETDVVSASYLFCEGSKEERASKCSEGFEYASTTFENLSELLSNDFVFSPFEFKDGVRNKDNVISGTKWVCLDIDDSKITDEECHSMLREINHHIARTSDYDNPFKFRLIVELDSFVDVDDKHWRNFIKSISEYLSVKSDLLPKSQIYFGYSGRNVLSVLDGETINAKEHVMLAYSESSNKTKSDVTKMSAKQRKELLSNPMDTFMYAFECDNDGTGSRSLIRAAYHARDLGMEIDDIIALMHEINNYWSSPMDEQRLENTIISQIRRF